MSFRFVKFDFTGHAIEGNAVVFTEADAAAFKGLIKGARGGSCEENVEFTLFSQRSMFGAARISCKDLLTDVFDTHTSTAKIHSNTTRGNIIQGRRSPTFVPILTKLHLHLS